MWASLKLMNSSRLGLLRVITDDSEIASLGGDTDNPNVDYTGKLTISSFYLFITTSIIFIAVYLFYLLYIIIIICMKHSHYYIIIGQMNGTEYELFSGL